MCVWHYTFGSLPPLVGWESLSHIAFTRTGLVYFLSQERHFGEKLVGDSPSPYYETEEAW